MHVDETHKVELVSQPMREISIEQYQGLYLPNEFTLLPREHV
jgi:hypothetical protein